MLRYRADTLQALSLVKSRLIDKKSQKKTQRDTTLTYWLTSIELILYLRQTQLYVSNYSLSYCYSPVVLNGPKLPFFPVFHWSKTPISKVLLAYFVGKPCCLQWLIYRRSVSHKNRYFQMSEAELKIIYMEFQGVFFYNYRNNVITTWVNFSELLGIVYLVTRHNSCLIYHHQASGTTQVLPPMNIHAIS